MSAMGRVLSSLRGGKVRAEVTHDSGLPSDLVDLMVHEANGPAVTGAQRVELVKMNGPASGPSCPPIGCKGCFFAQDCASFTPVN